MAPGSGLEVGIGRGAEEALRMIANADELEKRKSKNNEAIKISGSVMAQNNMNSMIGTIKEGIPKWHNKAILLRE